MISLVTGATGFIGSRLIEQLLADEENLVYALIRHPAKLRWLKPSANLILLRGDLLSMPVIPGNCEVVFHLAGLTKALKPDDYYTVNWLGTASLLKKLEESGINPRFVHLSSLAAGRPSPNGEPVKEDEPACPASPYGKSKLLAEQEVLKYKAKIPVVILRAAAVYGPRDRDFLQFFQIIKKGWLPSFTKKVIMSLCYVDDLVQALQISAQSGLKSGEIYNVADPVPKTWEDIGLEAARILGCKVKKIKISLGLVKTAAGLSELSSKISGKPSALNLSKYQDLEKLSWVAEVSKIKRELGFETRWDFSQGLQQTIDWYQKNGWL
ncbi:MAG: NAD-dependent epimerase/dehydratase family protein [Candidatus Saccharicenans sp.]